MAQISTDTIVITISKLVKDGTEETTSVTDEVLTTIEQVVEGLLPSGYIIEAVQA